MNIANDATISTFPMQVFHNPSSKFSSANEHMLYVFTLALNVQRDQPITNLIPCHMKPIDHTRPLSEAENALLLSTHTPATYTLPAQRNEKGRDMMKEGRQTGADSSGCVSKNKSTSAVGRYFRFPKQDVR